MTETQDVINARHILAAWRTGEPVTQSEKELAEGVFEHVVRSLLEARRMLRDIQRVLEET